MNPGAAEELAAMSDIIAGIAVNSVLIYVACLLVGWFLRARRGGPRERALFVRSAVAAAGVMLGIAVWTAAGIAAFVYGSVFWQGAYAGGSAVLWLLYVPALVWWVRAGRRLRAEARAADAA